MKKIMPILLVILLMVGLMPVAAFAAEEEQSDTFNPNGKLTATSENDNFELSAGRGYSDGWMAGRNDGPLTISATNDNLTITHIDVVVIGPGNVYDRVNVSGGTKQPNGEVANGTTVSVNGINASKFSFSSEKINIEFGKITVYYKVKGTGSIFSEGNGAIICLIGVAAVIAVVVLVIMKKKKKVA